ncbi:MAG TPA: hypothetical protein VHU87_01430 [Rhizomicrobium sp.]|nr:hypothetical protein [Rhizomicrobium sp.]
MPKGIEPVNAQGLGALLEIGILTVIFGILGLDRSNKSSVSARNIRFSLHKSTVSCHSVQTQLNARLSGVQGGFLAKRAAKGLRVVGDELPPSVSNQEALRYIHELARSLHDMALQLGRSRLAGLLADASAEAGRLAIAETQSH